MKNQNNYFDIQEFSTTKLYTFSKIQLYKIGEIVHFGK